MKHQDVVKVRREVGCSQWIGGENVGYNYESGGVARACVEQWGAVEGPVCKARARGVRGDRGRGALRARR